MPGSASSEYRVAAALEVASSDPSLRKISIRACETAEVVASSCCAVAGDVTLSCAARNRASPVSDCSTCSCSARSTILRMEKSSTAVQMVSTSTKESSSLEKTLPVIQAPGAGSSGEQLHSFCKV